MNVVVHVWNWPPARLRGWMGKRLPPPLRTSQIVTPHTESPVDLLSRYTSQTKLALQVYNWYTTSTPQVHKYHFVFSFVFWTAHSQTLHRESWLLRTCKGPLYQAENQLLGYSSINVQPIATVKWRASWALYGGLKRFRLERWIVYAVWSLWTGLRFNLSFLEDNTQLQEFNEKNF